MKRVVVLSYYNDANFGDRLGFHIANSILPPDAIVTHAAVKPWTVPDEPIDLLVLGIGNSLNAATVRRDELFALMDRVPHTIGLFGTQYRHQYQQLLAPGRFNELLDRLTYWFARYEDDVRLFGRGRDNVHHLGDWLISAFPLAQWRDPRTFVVDAAIKERDDPMDRVIQRIQHFRRVSSYRLHPLLCALTSAETVRYFEQREDGSGQVSGKFNSMLRDVLGQGYPEETWFQVDRAKVAAYKVKVAANLQMLRGKIAELLAE